MRSAGRTPVCHNECYSCEATSLYVWQADYDEALVSRDRIQPVRAMILPRFLIVALVIATSAFSAGIEVPLTVTETAGIERHQWPVRTGVPIPKGALRSLEKLQILDRSGRFVPAHFAVASRWWDDGSIQWVHCDFAATVPAKGETIYQLRELIPLPDFPSPVGLIPRGKDFEVITGPLRLVLGGNSNQLLDQVWVDEGWGYNFNETTKILDSGNFDWVLTSRGRVYRTSHWAQNRIEVEEYSALRAVVRMSGSFALEGQKEKRLDYLARLTVFGGKTYFKLDLTLLNRPGARGLPIDDLSIVLKLNLNPDQKFAFGTDSEDFSGDFSTSREAGISQLSADRCKRTRQGGSPAVEENRSCRSAGWADLSDDSFGLSVAVRSFWRLYPKAFSARNDGTLTVKLFPSQDSSDVMAAGSARTHETLFHFHGKRQWASGQVRKILLGFQRPIYAVAPSSWYCRGTQASGRLLEAAARLKPEFFGLQQKLDNWLATRRDALLASRDEGGAGHGVFRFGDPQALPGNSAPAPEILQGGASGAHGLYLHFFRTGDLKSLEMAEEILARAADEGLAAESYSPADRMGALPGSSVSAGEIEALFDSYLLTANRRFLDAARFGIAEALKKVNSGSVQTPSELASAMQSALRGFAVTGDRRWLESTRALAGLMAAWQDGDRAQMAKVAPMLVDGWRDDFRGGLAPTAETSGAVWAALRRFSELAGDKTWLPRLTRAADWLEHRPEEWDAGKRQLVRSPLPGFELALGLAAVFEDTREQKYWDWALDVFRAAVEGTNPASPSPPFGQSLVAGQRFLWFLSTEFPATPKRDVSFFSGR